jgi:hypothetical protein
VEIHISLHDGQGRSGGPKSNRNPPLGQISIKHALWIQKISAHDVVQEAMLNAAVSATVGHFLLALHEKEEEARETRPLM